MIRILGAVCVVLVARAFIISPAFAGGPEMEIEKAHIDDVIFDHRGVVLIVSGIAKLAVPRVKGDPPAEGAAKFI
ncbi:MAG: hypothetical protein ACR2OX_10930, partial [Methyloligellaceae bacterium]